MRRSEAGDIVATRLAYDTVASDYADLLNSHLQTATYDRSMLAAFAELIHAGSAVRGVRVADLGCGPGRIAAHLDSLGLDAFGIDLSPGMVDVARRRHPALAFEVGSIDSLELPNGSVAGVLAWYSIIHTPPDRLGDIFAEFARVLIPGGVALLAFQTPSVDAPADRPEVRHLDNAYGHDIDLDAYRLPVGMVSSLLGDTGFAVEATLVRAPAEDERTDQAYIIARTVIVSS
jgi:SAM-dependent methyltransferase